MLAHRKAIEGWHRLTEMPTYQLRSIELFNGPCPRLQVSRVGCPPTNLRPLPGFPLVGYDSSSSVKFLELFLGGRYGRYEAHGAKADALLNTIEELKRIAANEQRGFPFQLIDRATLRR